MWWRHEACGGGMPWRSMEMGMEIIACTACLMHTMCKGMACRGCLCVWTEMQRMPMRMDSRNCIVVCTMLTTMQGPTMLTDAYCRPLHRYHPHQSVLAHVGWIVALSGAEVIRVVTATIGPQCAVCGVVNA